MPRTPTASPAWSARSAPGFGYHLVSPHDGEDGYPGLAPHAEVPYGVAEEATFGWTLSVVFAGVLSLWEPYPLYLDGL